MFFDTLSKDEQIFTIVVLFLTLVVIILGFYFALAKMYSFAPFNSTA